MTHTHNIVDSGKHFVINPLLRTITTETTELILSQGDHNSKRYTFDIPRIVEGHDMSVCNRVEVHYDNISKNKKETAEGVYIVDDIVVNENTVSFSWLISGNATRLAGTVQFWINFCCTNENDEVIYSWGTGVFKGVRVNANNRNTDVVIDIFPDVLEQWKKEIIDEVGVGVTDEQISAAVSDYLDEHPIDGGVQFTTDATLTLNPETSVLSVNTTNLVEQDNTLPITSAGVYSTVGNIEALLKTI